MANPVAKRWELFAAIIRWMRTLATNADSRELETCGEDIRRIAADVGINTDDLRRLAPLGSDAAALLPQMMGALRLDPTAVPRDVLRDLQRVCSVCGVKKECACELARGAADATFAEFCPNADTLQALQLEMSQWR